MVCSCRPGADGKGCGEDCINFHASMECHPKHCPCGEGCQNQRRAAAPLRPRETRERRLARR